MGSWCVTVGDCRLPVHERSFERAVPDGRVWPEADCLFFVSQSAEADVQLDAGVGLLGLFLDANLTATQVRGGKLDKLAQPAVRRLMVVSSSPNHCRRDCR